ncbi:MAG: AAA family ATPase, partial [Bacteroidia bacterium]|nr:AAA family ATPase [Bacteroidia bacterium]
MSITLSQAAATAAKFINQTNRHIFLTGKAGTGKTTFLKHIIGNTHKKAAIVAPTGIAAINAGGSTIHSMFQLPFGSFVPVANYRNNNLSIQLNDKTSLFKNHHLSSIKKSLLREIELLIIDEVSMLRADLLDAMDAKMRQARGRNNLSFGGVQVLFIGDMFQLPPVIKDEEWKVLSEFYKSPYFFDAQVLQTNPPIYIELDKIFRQSNQVFIDLLNNLRNNTVTSSDSKLLNSYYKPGFKQQNGDNYINLTTHNYKANTINKSFLDDLKAPSFNYYAEVTGDFPENLFPLEAKLELKIGAQIMFIKNDISGKQLYFNGKIAKVSNLSQKEITVQFEDGTYHTLEKYTWENKRFKVNSTTNEIEEEVLGEFKQYPIKLAWAITVHKSQGLTFENAIIDVADAFAPGQVYVELSRLKDLNGLVLTSPINFESLKGDLLISSFSEKSIQQQSLEVQLSKETISYLNYYLNVCYDFSLLSNSFKKHAADLLETKKRKPKASLIDWAKNHSDNLAELSQVALKFSGQLNSIIQKQESDWKALLYKRVVDAQNYFTPLLKKV